MKNALFVAICLIYSLQLAAQTEPDVVVVKGEAEVIWEQDNMTKDQAKKKAQEQAEIDALQKQFGIVITKGNSTYVKNNQNGKEVETNSTFNMIGNTYVPGEIIEILDTKFEELKGEKSIKKGRKTSKVEVISIKCTIKAKARPMSNNKVSFETFTLSGNMKNNKAEAYKSGDSFYLYFRTPVSGYVTVFIDDSKQTVRVLPYQTMASKYENGIPVEADKDYIFFSPSHKYFGDDLAEVDEIELAAYSEQDLNVVYVIFSTEPFNKPRLKKDVNDDLLTEKEKAKRYTLPSSLDSNEFQNWLIDNLSKRENFQRQVINITIEK